MSLFVGQNLNPNESEDLSNFQKLLALSKDKLECNPSAFQGGDFWKTFEGNVAKALESSRNELNLDWNIEYVGGHKFPDIVAHINKTKSLGIEVKTLSTRTPQWKIMGGSIMESTKVEGIERIHVFAAKQQPFEIRYRPFEECVADVAVTHSPRYMLDMDLKDSASIFDKIHKSYSEIQKMENPFIAFREHLIQKRTDASGENNLWWCDKDSFKVCDKERAEADFAQQLIEHRIKFWNTLTLEERDLYKAKMLIFFPEIFKGDYNQACKWLLQNELVICPNFRDLYSAGGKETLYGKKVPKVLGVANSLVDLFAQIFANAENRATHFSKWVAASERHIKQEHRDVFMKIAGKVSKIILPPHIP
mgnify:FL=1